MAGTPKTEPVSPERSSIFSDITTFFTSVKTTITLLFVLASASIIGTVIPQDTGLDQLKQTVAPLVYRIMIILDLGTVYRSWWFILLLVLLALNLLACLVRRLSAIPDEWKGDSQGNSFSFTVSDARSASDLKGMFQQAFRKVMGAKAVVVTGQEGHDLVWTKHRVYLLGFPFIHAGIVVILLGGLIGLFYGFKGNIQIEEGGTGKEFRLFPSGEKRALPFQIAVDQFTLTRYPTGQPKEFRSDVRLIRDDKEVLKGSIVVNSPMTFEGLSLYQSDYRLLGIKEVSFALVGPGDQKADVRVRPRETSEVTGTPYKVRLVSLDPGTTKKGQGAEISVEGPGDETKTFSVFRNEPAKLGDSELQFVDYTPLYATGLQVAHDPGSIVVWVGCGSLILGFFLTLFTNHRRLTIEMKTKAGSTQIRISGRSRRLRGEFRKSVEQQIYGIVKEKGK
ncbi:MAG: cytochrome c biogenesis protein ResB [Desulfomonile tiedjei]|nr:cytochrome c biogenesis protein ResB [Desulfomonile tiedjei]